MALPQPADDRPDGFPGGFKVLPAALDEAEQAALLDDVLAVLAAAPAYQPTMPKSGKPLSVTMTNCGPLGWVTDREGGYRYQAQHPESGRPWPPIPRRLLDLWVRHGDYADPPEACLVNLYRAGARMGLHIDQDEEAADAPVVSVSLGDTALFRIGGARRRDPSRSLKLHSGAVVVLGGAARHCYHGVDRIYPGSSALLPQDKLPGVRRINLTLRRVTRGERGS